MQAAIMPSLSVLRLNYADWSYAFTAKSRCQEGELKRQRFRKPLDVAVGSMIGSWFAAFAGVTAGLRMGGRAFRAHRTRLFLAEKKRRA